MAKPLKNLKKFIYYQVRELKKLNLIQSKYADCVKLDLIFISIHGFELYYFNHLLFLFSFLSFLVCFRKINSLVFCGHPSSLIIANTILLEKDKI